MLLKIIGWFWLISGIMFLFNPDKGRRYMQKKSIKKLKKFLFALALCVGVLLIKATWGLEGVLAKVVLIFGLIAIAKAFFFLKAKSAQQAIEWFLAQPIKTFRIFAVCQIVVGAVILSV